jgi:hypothetical protein
MVSSNAPHIQAFNVSHIPKVNSVVIRIFSNYLLYFLTLTIQICEHMNLNNFILESQATYIKELTMCLKFSASHVWQTFSDQQRVFSLAVSEQLKRVKDMSSFY